VAKSHPSPKSLTTTEPAPSSTSSGNGSRSANSDAVAAGTSSAGWPGEWCRSPDGGKGRPRARRMLTDQDPTQRQLGDLFNIDQYAPTR
jgi:hypothetical protein